MLNDHPDDRTREAVERDLRQMFEQLLPARVERALTLRQHPLTPNHHFAAASAECIELWRDGYFYSVVMVSQAIVEGICRFVRERHGKTHKAEPLKAIAELEADGTVTRVCAGAMKRIWNRSTRNDLHHMNPGVQRLKTALPQLAERCIRDLNIVESEIFAFEIFHGKIVPTKPRYWDIAPDGTVSVYLRFL